MEKDTVRCNNCMRIVEVEYDSDKCPICGFDGALMDLPIEGENNE